MRQRDRYHHINPHYNYHFPNTTPLPPLKQHRQHPPLMIPLCCCPCANDDDDDDDVEEGAESKNGSGSALASKCFISNCANIRNEFTLQFSIFVKQYCTYLPSIYDVCVLSVCICIVNGFVSYLIVRLPSVYTLCHEWLTIVK